MLEGPFELFIRSLQGIRVQRSVDINESTSLTYPLYCIIGVQYKIHI